MYKHMLGKPVDHRDLESIDPEYYKSLVWMLENDIEDIIDLTFSVERDEFGKIETVDLIPDGRNIAVTNENKHDYVRRIADQRLSIDIKQQMDVRRTRLTSSPIDVLTHAALQALLRGLYEIVPKDLLQIFSERELELLISGLPTIDADEWRSHTGASRELCRLTATEHADSACLLQTSSATSLLTRSLGTSGVPCGPSRTRSGPRCVTSIARLPLAHC